MTKIAVLDDKGRLIDDFKEILEVEIPEAEFDPYERADDALDAIEDGGQWDIWIVDLMMARGRLTAVETEDGLSTGIRVIERLVAANAVSCKVIAYTLRDVNHEEHFNNNTEIMICPKKDFTVTDIVKKTKSLLADAAA